MSLYGKDIYETKYISCLTTLLEKYNEIWKKVKNGLKKEFDSEPTYNEKYLKAMIKSYNRKVNTNFDNNKIQKNVLLVISNFYLFCF